MSGLEFRGKRGVVKFESERTLSDFIDCGKWSYYLIGSLGGTKYFGYVEFVKTVDFKKIGSMFNCRVERLQTNRRCMLDHIRSICDGVVECGEKKRCGGEVTKEKWNEYRKIYASGDLENLSDYVIKVLRGKQNSNKN